MSADSVRFVDSHCHLSYGPDDDPVDVAVAAATEAGVLRIVDVGTDRATSLAALEKTAGRDGLYATVGLHPHDASDGTETIADLVDAPGVTAIGECGLDYHYDNSPREVQREAFATQIGWANERDLPLVIHSRSAWDDTFAVLDDVGVPARTVFHCFTGGPAEATMALERGAYLSFSGIVTFRNAVEVRAAAALCPPDRLLVETDSPYLAPVPNRGRPNRPAWLPLVAAGLAEARGQTLTEVAGLTWANTARVLGLG